MACYLLPSSLTPPLAFSVYRMEGNGALGGEQTRFPFPQDPMLAICDKSKIKEWSIFYSEKIIPSILNDILAFNTFFNMIVLHS